MCNIKERLDYEGVILHLKERGMDNNDIFEIARICYIGDEDFRMKFRLFMKEYHFEKQYEEGGKKKK